MKRNLILMCLCFLMVETDSFAQSFFTKLKKGLEKVNETLESTNTTLNGGVTTKTGNTSVSSPNKEYKLEFTEAYVEGYDVVVCFSITNTTEESKGLNWGGGTAYDNLGNKYSFGHDGFTIGGRSTLGVELPSEIPLKAVIRLKNVNTKATSIKQIDIGFHQINGFKAKNITINWEDGTTITTGKTTVLSPTRDLKVEYKDCQVDDNNNVTVNFIITNTTTDELGLNSGGGTAWDDQGESHGISSLLIGGTEVGPLGVRLPAEIPLKGEILIKGVSRNAKLINLIKMDTYQYKGFEIRNVEINRDNQ